MWGDTTDVKHIHSKAREFHFGLSLLQAQRTFFRSKRLPMHSGKVPEGLLQCFAEALEVTKDL
jgi:hypothetical protein